MRFYKKVSLIYLILFTMLCFVSQASAQNDTKASESDPFENEVHRLKTEPVKQP